MVDALVTPASMRAMFSTKKDEAKGQLKAVDASKADLVIRGDGLDQFTLVDESASGKGGEMIFKQQGLGWKLSALRLPTELGNAMASSGESAGEVADKLEATADRLEAMSADEKD